MNPETRFSKAFRKKFPPGHNMRVENPALPGTPDINICIDGVEFWIETKRVERLPKKPDTPVFTGVMRPEQKLWLRNRAKFGGKCYIAAHVDDEGLTYIIPGHLAYEFEAMSRAQLDAHTVPLESLWKKS